MRQLTNDHAPDALQTGFGITHPEQGADVGNELAWLDWSKLRYHEDIHRFVRLLIGYRHGRDLSSRTARTSLNEILRRSTIEWHGTRLHRPDWGERSHSLAVTFERENGRYRLHAMFNAYWEPLTFDLPEVDNGRRWRRCIDTALPPPDDIQPRTSAPFVAQPHYVVQPRSIVFLVGAVNGDGAEERA